MGPRAHVLIIGAKTLIAMEKNEVDGTVSLLTSSVVVKGKVHPCTGTEALYRPYGP